MKKREYKNNYLQKKYKIKKDKQTMKLKHKKK